ncbi:MAG: hypothetical protein NTU83_01140, partial [Candidatus Hydrogenedentes bacterium]|nr:hypothetical protein [Candidatus Hydrogenedentota bacterium]
MGDKVTAKVIGIDPIERKIALSIREYQRDIDTQAQAQYGQTGREQSVNVGDIVGDAIPRSMLQAGRSLADAANELMAVVSAQLASQGNAAQAEKAVEAEAEKPVEAEVETPVEAEAEEP